MDQYQVSTAEGAVTQPAQVTLLQTLPQQVMAAAGQAQPQVSPRQQ